MASPLIMIDGRLSVRTNRIVAVEVSGSSVIVHLDAVQTPFRIDMDNCADARSKRNCILETIHDAEKIDWRTSTNAVHTGSVEIVLSKNTPDESRLSRVSRVAGLLLQEFGDTLKQVGFQHDLWGALQVIYGPGGAAEFISDCQNPR